MPVVLVNPSSPRRRRKRRANPKRRRRRNPSRTARAGRLARRRNPTARKFSDAAIGGLLSTLGGGVAYGIHWGTSYAPVGNVGQTLILAGAGTVTAIATSMLADERAGNGVMGGTTALVLGRLHAQWLLGKMVKKKTDEAPTNGTEASGLYGRRGASGPLPLTVNPHRQSAAYGAGQVAAYTGPLQGGAGAVVPRGSLGAAGPLHITHEAGAMMDPSGRIMPAPATTSARMGFAGDESFKQPEPTPGASDAGASRYVPGGVRWFGPRSWAYEAGKVFRSAHDVRR